MVSLVVRAKDAVGLFDVAAAPDADADFAARASAAGVKYATNFTDVYVNGVLQPARAIASKQDMIDESIGIGDSSFSTRPVGEQAADHLAWDTTKKLSGAASLRINTMAGDGAAGGSWAFRPNGTDATVFRELYCQFSVYYPRETLGYRYALNTSVGQLKVINFGQFGGGQIVVSNWRFMGFPSAFSNGGGMIAEDIGAIISTPNPWGTDAQRNQDAIDAGGPTSTQTEQLLRYGPLGRGLDAVQDLGFNAGQPLVYLRAQPSGWPDTRAATNGVPFVLDGWTTIECYMKYNVANPAQSTFQMWAAPYGQPPKLIMSGIGNVPLNTNTTNSWDRFELLNYDTERTSQVGVRPLMFTYYDEVIVSSQPISFPGGHPLTGHVSYPSWIDTIEVGKWADIGLNTMASVDSEDDSQVNPAFPSNAPWHQVQGLAALTNAWNGGCFASREGTFGKVCYWGGGHNAYLGSDMYGFNMETRLWERLTDPYPGPYNQPYANAVFEDGSPVPPHTYDGLEYDPITRKFIKLRSTQKSDSDSSNPWITAHTQTYDFTTGQWANFAGGGRMLSSVYSCYDSSRGVCWVAGGTGADNFFQFNPLTNTFQTFTNKTPTMTDSVAAYDPVNDLFVVCRFRDDTRVQAWSLAGTINSNAPAYLTDTGTAPTKESSSGWEWSPNKQGFVYYRRNGAVYLLKHTSGTWNGGTWTWSLLTSGSNVVVPPTEATDNGVYSRFQVCSYANGTREVAIVCNSVTGSTYAFRIA